MAHKVFLQFKFLQVPCFPCLHTLDTVTWRPNNLSAYFASHLQTSTAQNSFTKFHCHKTTLEKTPHGHMATQKHIMHTSEGWGPRISIFSGKLILIFLLLHAKFHNQFFWNLS